MISNSCNSSSLRHLHQLNNSKSDKKEKRQLTKHSYLRCKVHQGAKASWGLEEQEAVEARVFLSEAYHMSNIYFMILMMVVSYFYITFL